MAVKFAWLLLTLCSAIEGAKNSCLYQYIQQPETRLNCNPLGSRLQVHCGATGPLLPSFHIQWYHRSKSHKKATQLTNEEYFIRNNVQDVMEEERTTTSILLTRTIDSTQTELCFWCQIEFSGLTLPIKSNVFCIESEEQYAALGNCESNSVMLVKTTLQCVHISHDFASMLERLKNQTDIRTSPSVHPSTTERRQANSGLVVTLSGNEAIKSLSTFIVNTNLQSLHIGTQFATSSSKTKVTATPSSRPTEPFVSSISVKETPVQVAMNNTDFTTTDGMEETVPRSSFEGALYAAIIVCLLFVGVIVALAIVILCLSRRKCSCLEQAIRSLRQKFRSGNNSRRNSQEADTNHVSAANHVSEHIDGSSLEESGSKSIKVEVSYSGQKKNVTSQSSNGSGHSKRSTIERESHRSTSAEQPPPELPPKPKRLLTTSYDHLEPVVLRAEKSARATKRTTSMPSESTLSTSEMYGEKPPLKVPHHLYHTLEDDGLGLLRSATASRASSQAALEDGNIDRVSIHLQEIFDDPRYARLKLDPYGNEEFVTRGLTKQKDFSRSSPSIVNLIQPHDMLMKRGATERRSLRLPRWISTTKTRPDIYEN